MAVKRIPMVLELSRHSERVTGWPCREVRAADADALAILMYAAFRGTIDDEGETFANAAREIERTFAGKYGRLLTDCSFVIEGGEFLSSACLVSWYEPISSPFVVFTMTRPENKAQGMARFLLTRSIHALTDRGHSQLALIVTDGNIPAQSLYASIGFRETPSGRSPDLP